MATIYPFRALRPTPARAADVAAVPHDALNTPEARGAPRDNPLRFLPGSRAEIELPADTHPHPARGSAPAVRNFERLRSEAPLVQEDTPSLYFYKLRMGTHEQTGLAGCFSIDEYEHDIIRKHERTR